MKTLFSRTLISIALMSALIFAIAPAKSHADDTLQNIPLPAPYEIFAKYENNFLKALQNRSTHRTFTDAPLDEAHLAGILWSAYGINRENGKRTIPTASNRQDMLLFALTESGLWLYNTENYTLEQKINGDVRKFLSSRISQGAPLTLIYVQDMNKASSEHYGYLHAGSMYQNVGLYCAMADLGNVVVGSVPSDFMKNMNMPENYRYVVSQSIGFKK